MIKRLLYILLFTGIILGGLFGLKFYQIQDAVSQFQPPPPAVVAITEVKQAEWVETLSAVGSLAAKAGVNINNEVAGNVKAIHFRSGQSVKAGELLIELDTSTDNAELKGLKAERRLAEIRFHRSKKLITGKFIAQSDYDENKALLEEASAAVAAKETVINKKKIRAPFAGDLGIRKVDLGQYLEPGSAIVLLQQLTPIYIDFTVPEKQFSRLALRLPVAISVQAYSKRSFMGEIIAFEPAVDPGSRSIKVRAQIPNQDKLLRAGMFGQVNILSGQTRSVLTLPDTAITYNPYGNFVFVVDSNANGMTVKSRQVETGQTENGRIEIRKGLKPGDQVVSAGQVKLRNGMPVVADKLPAPGERAAP